MLEHQQNSSVLTAESNLRSGSGLRGEGCGARGSGRRGRCREVERSASGSVSRVLSLDDHLSRTPVARRLKHATRTYDGQPYRVPICACSRWGFPSRAVADALVRSYRTVSAFLPLPRAEARVRGGVFFSVALSVGSPRPAVSWHLALWSPDFPHIRRCAIVWPAREWYSSKSKAARLRETRSPSKNRCFKAMKAALRLLGWARVLRAKPRTRCGALRLRAMLC